MKEWKKKIVFPRYESRGRSKCRGKNPEERTATKLYSKPLFSKDLEDQFIEIIHTMEVKYFGLKR